jgi:hemerythrin-like metal-binding protein
VSINPAATSPARATFEWCDDFLVGVAEIDEQHRRLIEMIGSFYEALREKKPASEALAALLDGLVEYTRYHFATEERLMARSGFPASKDHREQHARFVRTVGDLVARVSSGQLVLSLEATSFLREWLVNHILKSDKALGRHLVAHGTS